MRLVVSIEGSLLGTAVGDALGLPYEALSRRRAARLLGPPTRHRFLPGHGMVSDDTEHTCIVLHALAVSAGDDDRFARSLGWGLRWWFLGLPAGIGFATLRACLKLWMGFGPRSSGVRSAGNGGAMRCAIIGAAVRDLGTMRGLVETAVRVTHRDARAVQGALAVALAARHAAGPGLDHATYLRELRALLGTDGEEVRSLVEQALASAAEGEATEAFAARLGLARGVTGFVMHTVPVCLQAVFSHPRDYRACVQAIIGCGGDTDTCAAIAGGIVGSAVGAEGIPDEWLERIAEWPRSLGYMRRLAAAAARALRDGSPTAPPRLNPLALLVRNAAFMVIVLAHGVRRCLPPY